MAKTVLVIDDDPTQRRLLQAAVEKAGFACRTAPDGEAGIALAADPKDGIDVTLLDLTMPGLSGMETLERLAAKRPDLPVIILTATSGIDTIVQSMRGGAVDFIVKPANPERVVVSIRNALKMQSLSGEVKRLARKADGGMSFDDMIASAPPMRQVVRLAERAAASDIPVLILGESGVGKEVVARCIQGASARAGKPFVTVNCGAIPENLVESILFGEGNAFQRRRSLSVAENMEKTGESHQQLYGTTKAGRKTQELVEASRQRRLSEVGKLTVDPNSPTSKLFIGDTQAADDFRGGAGGVACGVGEGVGGGGGGLEGGVDQARRLVDACVCHALPRSKAPLPIAAMNGVANISIVHTGLAIGARQHQIQVTIVV